MAQQPQRATITADHDGGDLLSCVDELASGLAPEYVREIGTTPVESVLEALKASSPKVLETFAQFVSAAKAASVLSDSVAEQWKQKGNEDFSSGNLDVAIIHYTKGMTFARDSNLLAVLLNNRATVFYQQKRYRDALCDSHKAVCLKPDYWKALGRRGKCLEAIGYPQLGEKDVTASEAQSAADANQEAELAHALERPFRTVENSLPPSFELFPFDSVAVQRDAKGRFVVATKQLEPQTILLETPYAIVPKAEGMFTACAHCMHRTSSLYPSDHYREHNVKSRGLFCSQQCADVQWKYYGERESAHSFYLLCSVDMLLALRMIQTSFDACSNMLTAGSQDTATRFDPLSDNKFGKGFMDLLVGFSKEVAPYAEVGGKESIMAALALACGVIATPFQAEKLRKALRQVIANAFQIQCVDRIIANAESHSFVTVTPGKALYAVASLFNHSCDPNCFLSFRGNPHSSSSQLCIRLTRPCMEGEELTISYASIDKTKNHSTRARIRALRGLYGFNCTCTVCRNVVDEVVRKEDEAHYMKAADYYQKGRRLMREGNYPESINVLYQSYEIVMRYICPPPRPPQMMLPKTHDALAQAFLLNGEKDKCVEHLKEALRLTIELHGGEYADLVREYVKLAMLSGEESYATLALGLLTKYYCPSEFLDAEKLYVASAIQTKPTPAEASSK